MVRRPDRLWAHTTGSDARAVKVTYDRKTVTIVGDRHDRQKIYATIKALLRSTRRSISSANATRCSGRDCSLVGLPAGAEVIGGPVFFEPAALRRLGLALTWGGFLLEAALACAFLLSRLPPLHRSRDMLLMTFAVVTYAAAPVAGFGWLLAAMGCAQQCDPDRVGLRAGCLAVFALVLAYSETPLVPLLLRSWFRARRLVTC
jgi:hypothetical protein